MNQNQTLPGVPRGIWASQGPIFYPKFFWPVVSYKSLLKLDLGKAQALEALVAMAVLFFINVTKILWRIVIDIAKVLGKDPNR